MMQTRQARRRQRGSVCVFVCTAFRGRDQLTTYILQCTLRKTHICAEMQSVNIYLLALPSSSLSLSSQLRCKYPLRMKPQSPFPHRIPFRLNEMQRRKRGLTCVCARTCVLVCFGGLVIRALCQLMRGERGHLFRGAGLRAPGWNIWMGGWMYRWWNSCWVLGGGCAALGWGGVRWDDVYLLWWERQTLTSRFGRGHLSRCRWSFSETRTWAGLWQVDPPGNMRGRQLMPRQQHRSYEVRRQVWCKPEF